jgi:catechol 2,3-dioxygenase
MTLPKTVFRPPFAVTRASHLVSVVTDLPASRAFYADTLGMIVSDEDRNTLYLRGIEEGCHHSLVLKAGPAPVCERVGMRVMTEEDLDLAQQYFQRMGLPAQWVEVPFQGRTLHTTDVNGTPLELCAQMKTEPRRIMDFDAHRGACPQRLDHFQIFTPNVQAACEFYMAIGFRLSEYIVRDGSDELRMIFLQRKGNPHDIVFAHQSEQRLHHVAFTTPEAHNLMYIADLCGKNGYGKSVERGPGRHFGPGYARYVYLRDPDGHRIELFNNHYQTIDMEDEPIRWEASRLNRMGSWGPGPSASWLNEASPFVSPQPSVTPKRAREAHAN